jgi:hypothetical protein
LTINYTFRKDQTLEKLAEEKKNQSTVAEVKVDYTGPQSGRGAPANRGQSRGGKGQYNNSNNQNNASYRNIYQSVSCQRGSVNPRGGRGGRGQNRGQNQPATAIVLTTGNFQVLLEIIADIV